MSKLKENLEKSMQKNEAKLKKLKKESEEIKEKVDLKEDWNTFKSVIREEGRKVCF